MSETIVGVIIGGIIGSVIPLATFWITEKRTRQERIITHLKEKKISLINEFSEIKEPLLKGMVENNYSVEIISKFMISLPKTVYEVFNNMMNDKEKNTNKDVYKFHYLNILNAMNKEITKIDEKIEKEING